MNPDPLLEGLARLAGDAPHDLIDKIAARWVTVEGPLGELFVVFTGHGVAFVRPVGETAAEEFRGRFQRPLLPASRPPSGLAAALRSGDTAGFAVDLRAVSSFQAEVLRAARVIPRGEVRSYAWVARQVNRPKALRAVGTALATNPVPLLIPCHRVTRSDGSLGRYLFGEEAKRQLLEAEGG